MKKNLYVIKFEHSPVCGYSYVCVDVAMGSCVVGCVWVLNGWIWACVYMYVSEDTVLKEEGTHSQECLQRDKEHHDTL